MSAIDTSKIDTRYPVPGQDNDSQGFRDNFFNISDALDVARTEITALEDSVEAIVGFGFVVLASAPVPTGWVSTGHYLTVENEDTSPSPTRYKIITKAP